MAICMIDDWPEVFRVSTPKARKSYRCQECGGAIHAGEAYRRDFTVCYGNANTAIYCIPCSYLMDSFFASLPENDLTFEAGGLRQAIIALRREYGVTLDGFEYPPESPQ